MDFPTPAKITYKKPSKVIKPDKSLNLLPVLIVIAMAVFIYTNVSKERIFSGQVKSTIVETQPVEPIDQFQCQGKVWCSQMSSYEEALFYIRNCPGTKMDGDGDGNPCERQF